MVNKHTIMICLVVSTPLKNMKVNRKDDIPDKWKIKIMFETTNQFWYHIYVCKTMP